MANFKLTPNPTFKAKVTIHRPGEQAGEILFTFKHYPINKFEELEKKANDKSVLEFVTDVVCDWDLEDEFNKDNLEILLNNYPAAGGAIFKTFYAELFGAREKN